VISVTRSICRVFVYGTLKPGGDNFDRYCRDRVVKIDRAKIRGDLYDLPDEGYPAVTGGDGWVEGFVLSFGDDRILVDLDELEEYAIDRTAADNIYDRRLVTAYYPDGSTLKQEVWVYVMSIERIRQFQGVSIAGGWWEKG
jgi:gamma-glutamylcyclotransferase (GGCT)/AIG2-like uncharacterized protein YtfP